MNKNYTSLSLCCAVFCFEGSRQQMFLRSSRNKFTSIFGLVSNTQTPAVPPNSIQLPPARDVI